MVINKVFKGTKGLEVRFAVDQDISDALEMILYYYKPESKIVSYVEAEAEGTGTLLGIIESVDEEGDWYFQGWAKLSNSKEVFTDIVRHKIFASLRDYQSSS